MRITGVFGKPTTVTLPLPLKHSSVTIERQGLHDQSDSLHNFGLVLPQIFLFLTLLLTSLVPLPSPASQFLLQIAINKSAPSHLPGHPCISNSTPISQIAISKSAPAHLPGGS